MAVIFGEFFLVSIRLKSSKNSAKIRSKIRGKIRDRRKFEKFGKLSICNFPDLTYRPTPPTSSPSFHVIQRNSPCPPLDTPPLPLPSLGGSHRKGEDKIVRGASPVLAAQREIPPPIAQYLFEIVSQRGVSHPFALFSWGIAQVSLRYPF